MGQVLHGSATPTEVVRRAIQHSKELEGAGDASRRQPEDGGEMAQGASRCEEAATRGYLSRDEAPPSFREAVHETGVRTCHSSEPSAQRRSKAGKERSVSDPYGRYTAVDRLRT